MLLVFQYMLACHVKEPYSAQELQNCFRPPNLISPAECIIEGRRKSVSSSSRNPSRDWLLSTTVEFANKSQSINSKKFRLLQVCFTLGIAFCRIDILLFSCTLVSLSMVDVNVSFANAFHFTRILICFSAIIIRRQISASCCYVWHKCNGWFFLTFSLANISYISHACIHLYP